MSQVLPDLSGMVVLVTGASGGVGSGVARQFGAAGASVVVHYRSAADDARQVVTDIGAAGGQALAMSAELRDPAAVDTLLRQVVDEFGRLDVLVNNAGVQPVRPLTEMTPDQWRSMFESNTHTTFLATRAATRQMIEQASGGAVISIASVEGSRPAVGHAHYSASKAAILMHTKAAALEYGQHGIRVNSVSPGLIDRPGLAAQWPEGVDRWRRSAPLARLGNSNDVGNACVFLASPLASWITGQDLVVDGGVSVNPGW